MTYEHDTKAYLIVINANRLNEKAMDLYHAAFRGEPTGHELSKLQQAMQEVGAALDAWIVGGDEE